MCFAYVVEQASTKKSLASSIWFAINYSELTYEHKNDFNHYIKYFYQIDENHKNIIDSLIKREILPITVVS